MSVQLPECAVCVTGDSAPPFFILCGLTLSSVSAENLVVPIVDQNKCHQHLKKNPIHFHTQHYKPCQQVYIHVYTKAHFRKVNYKTMTATMSVDAHQVNKSHTNPCCKLIITERLIQNKSGLAQCTCNMINEYCILYNAILLNHVSTFSVFLHHTVGVAHLSALPSAIHGLIHCLPVILHETTSYAAST